MKIALGLGCDRNTPVDTLRMALTAALAVGRAASAMSPPSAAST